MTNLYHATTHQQAVVLGCCYAVRNGSNESSDCVMMQTFLTRVMTNLAVGRGSSCFVVHLRDDRLVRGVMQATDPNKEPIGQRRGTIKTEILTIPIV